MYGAIYLFKKTFKGAKKKNLIIKFHANIDTYLYCIELTDSLENLGVDSIHDVGFHGNLKVIHMACILLHCTLKNTRNNITCITKVLSHFNKVNTMSILQDFLSFADLCTNQHAQNKCTCEQQSLVMLLLCYQSLLH